LAGGAAGGIEGDNWRAVWPFAKSAVNVQTPHGAAGNGTASFSNTSVHSQQRNGALAFRDTASMTTARNATTAPCQLIATT
jgi:hypothetical protein